MSLFGKKASDPVTDYFRFDVSSLLALRQYLEGKAGEGLLLSKVKNYTFEFTRTEPKKLRYCAAVLFMVLFILMVWHIVSRGGASLRSEICFQNEFPQVT